MIFEYREIQWTQCYSFVSESVVELLFSLVAFAGCNWYCTVHCKHIYICSNDCSKAGENMKKLVQ